MKNKLLKILDTKKFLFAPWRAEDEHDSPYQNFYLSLKKLFKHIIVFDPAKEYFRYGKEVMNKKFLNLIKKEMPDYVFMMLLYDEFEIETLEHIKKVSPKTITINLFSDDDSRYEDFSRYYIHFFDYAIVGVAKEDIVAPHKKDGIKNIALSHHTNCEIFKPIKIKKRFDVGFYGRANDSRAELVSFLLEKRINISVWGEGWAKYPKLLKAYKGYLAAEYLGKTVNETKINLCFTMGGYGKPNFKGRVIEIGACNSFLLLEYYKGYLNYFKENKELVMFKDKEDLLRKIKYYLNNENERKKIASNFYKRVIKYHNQDIFLKNFFLKLSKFKSHNLGLPDVHKKLISLKIDNLKDDKNLKEKIKDVEYISFLSNRAINSTYKNKIQAYSLEKSGKDISCCDYYVNSKLLGNYILYKAKVGYLKLEKPWFNSLLIPEQIMIRKSYFLKNYNRLKYCFLENNLNFIEDKNTVFVSIPLVKIKNMPLKNYEKQGIAFQMKFLDKLYSLYFQKKLLVSSYFYSLLVNAFFGKIFMFKAVKNALHDKKKLEKAKSRGF
ncbi:glycosyltransferase [Candidatus Pacearchaeota archaeon]|nr:glycosyltransferase [Candidatus Pacearchaeota archaeon]